MSKFAALKQQMQQIDDEIEHIDTNIDKVVNIFSFTAILII